MSIIFQRIHPPFQHTWSRVEELQSIIVPSDVFLFLPSCIPCFHCQHGNLWKYYWLSSSLL